MKDDDAAGAAGYRTYKNNRYASLGARRVIRVLRQFFDGKDKWTMSRSPESIDARTHALFETLNDAGVLQLLQAGIEEENEQAVSERLKREAKRNGASSTTPADRDDKWEREKQSLERVTARQRRDNDDH